LTSVNTKRKASKSSNDLYNTPTEALESAYNECIFDKFNTYYDPCDGLGNISNFLKSKGKKVICSDIEDYGKNHCIKADFLQVDRLPEGVECIVFNPPFKLTEEFIDKALSLCDNLIMFNRATVLETKSRSKKHKAGEWPLEWFYSFGNRVSCTEGVNADPTANSVWYGFYIYNKKYTGYPKIDWLFTK